MDREDLLEFMSLDGEKKHGDVAEEKGYCSIQTHVIASSLYSAQIGSFATSANVSGPFAASPPRILPEQAIVIAIGNRAGSGQSRRADSSRAVRDWRTGKKEPSRSYTTSADSES